MTNPTLPAGVIEPKSAAELAGVVPASAIARDEAYHYLTYLDALPTYDEIRNQDDPMALVKLFAPGPGTWWIASYDPDRRMAWGAAHLHEFEYGAIPMGELCKVRVRTFGLPIERDLYWTPQRLSEIAAEHGR